MWELSGSQFRGWGSEGVNVSDSMRFSGPKASHYTACHQTDSAAQRCKMSNGRVSHLSKLQAGLRHPSFGGRYRKAMLRVRHLSVNTAELFKRKAGESTGS